MIKSKDSDGNEVIDYHEILNCTINRNKIYLKKIWIMLFKLLIRMEMVVF